MKKKTLSILLLVTVFSALTSTLMVQAGGKPVKSVNEDISEFDWVYVTDWYDYQVHSTYWIRWTTWQYPDGTTKAIYEAKQWSRTTDADGKTRSWINMARVNIFTQKNGVRIVSEVWGDPWISLQIIKHITVHGDVKIDVDRYTVSKPPI